MDKTKINVDLEVEIEKLGLELINFKRTKEKIIKTCEKMVDYYRKLINTYQAEIAEKEKNINAKVIYLSQDIEFNETKTLKTLELPSFNIRITKEHQDIQLKDGYNIENIPENYVTTFKKPKWQQLKTQLNIVNNNIVLNETGEIVDYVEILEKPEKFEIKSKW